MIYIVIRKMSLPTRKLTIHLSTIRVGLIMRPTRLTIKTSFLQTLDNTARPNAMKLVVKDFMKLAIKMAMTITKVLPQSMNIVTMSVNVAEVEVVTKADRYRLPGI